MLCLVIPEISFNSFKSNDELDGIFISAEIAMEDSVLGGGELFSLGGLFLGSVHDLIQRLRNQRNLFRKTGGFECFDWMKIYNGLLDWRLNGERSEYINEIFCDQISVSDIWALPDAVECFDGDMCFIFQVDNKKTILIWKSFSEKTWKHAWTDFDVYIACWENFLDKQK